MLTLRLSLRNPILALGSRALLLGVSLALAGGVVPVASGPGGLVAPAAAASLYSAGHGDIGLAYDGSDLHLEFHGHAGAIVGGQALASDAEFEPGDIDILVNLTGIVTETEFADFGLPNGSRVGFLPPFEIVGSPFLGIASEELDSNDWSAVVWAITSVTGPGDFLLASYDPFGALQGSYGVGAVLPLTVGGHNHFLYLFTAPGRYEVTFVVQGILVDVGSGGSNLRTASGTFNFLVPVPEPSIPALLGSLSVAALWFCLVRNGRRSQPT